MRSGREVSPRNISLPCLRASSSQLKRWSCTSDLGTIRTNARRIGAHRSGPQVDGKSNNEVLVFDFAIDEDIDIVIFRLGFWHGI